MQLKAQGVAGKKNPNDGCSLCGYVRNSGSARCPRRQRLWQRRRGTPSKKGREARAGKGMRVNAECCDGMGDGG